MYRRTLLSRETIFLSIEHRACGHAQEIQHPTIKALCGSSPFNRPFNMWCIAFMFTVTALSPGPPPQLLKMMFGLCSGWVSSVINEKANKELRDAEIRDQPSKATCVPNPTD